MIFAIDNFAYIKDELPESRLKLLLNIEDLNNPIFNEVFNSLRSHQQEQYNLYKTSEEAKNYRKERNATLPYVDFTALPEVLDEELLNKIMEYQKEGITREAIFDALSEEHTTQIAQLEYRIRDEEEAKRRALLTDEERKAEDDWKEKASNNPTAFYGNIAEPDNVISYIIKYGYNPYTHEPETTESFHEKYDIDPKTGDPIPKKNKQ